jgi:uncharacterized protein YchJ
MLERPEIDRAWCERVLANPLRMEAQEDGRIRYWAYIVEIGKYLRVVTEPDGETAHTAFLDRRFRE